MTALRYTLLILMGLSAGLITAAAYVAFITMLGIIPKFAAKTKTAGECILYENCLIFGILIATLLQFFVSYSSAEITSPTLPSTVIGMILLMAIGLFGGIYVGFLIGGLSEVLNTIPIYARKTHIRKQLPLAIYSLALGKGIFILVQFLILNE